MKVRKLFKITSFLIMSVLLISIGKKSTSAQSLINREQRRYENYVTYLVDGFNKKNSWIVKFSRFRVHNWDTNSSQRQASETFVRWKKVTGRKKNIILPPYPREQREQMNRSIADAADTIVGIRAKFVVNGYNWIVFEPKKPMYFKGLVKRVSFWMWGGYYRYNIKIMLKDYLGNFYELDGGNVNFVGWKYITIKVPHTIRQRSRHMPANKPLRFMYIKLISDFDEEPFKFYVWFASMWAQVDLYRDRFWGEGLMDEPNW